MVNGAKEGIWRNGEKNTCIHIRFRITLFSDQGSPIRAIVPLGLRVRPRSAVLPGEPPETDARTGSIIRCFRHTLTPRGSPHVAPILAAPYGSSFPQEQPQRRETLSLQVGLQHTAA